jgi:AcrR family transcriptional regulator
MTDGLEQESLDQIVPEDFAPDNRDAATKAAVFAAGERLFALNGFRGVSVRDITAEAGVNIASLNYHFGSKDALIFEIFRRRAAELSRERARMLHEATTRHAGRPPTREILTALQRGHGSDTRVVAHGRFAFAAVRRGHDRRPPRHAA